MSTTFIAMGIAVLAVVGLVVNLGVLSLLSGALHFLFGKPRLEILKHERENGFAFGFRWNNSKEPAKFDRIKIRLFNPFAKPTQVDVAAEFTAKDSDFGLEVNFGPALQNIIETEGLDNSSIQIEVMSIKSSVTHHFEMKTRKFLEKYKSAKTSVGSFNDKHSHVEKKPVYHQNGRTFIADAIPETDGIILKIASNPAFAGAFTSTDAAAAAPQENFKVAKVWIEDGCIVCNACEAIYPEVFEVTETSCLIRPDAPLDHGLKVLEAAEACPVEIIKFTKA